MNPKINLKSSQLLFDEAQKLGLEPKWETDYGLFSVKLPESSQREFFFHTNFNCNGELSRILVKNKHFARLILEKNGFENIPYLLPSNSVELKHFFDDYQPIICKPLLGQQSRHIKLIKSREQLAVCSLKMTFFEKYIKGDECRYLLLQNEVIAVQRKKLVPTASNPWNLYYIGLPKSDWDQQLVQRSIKIVKLFKLNWAAVDYILDEEGKAWILEINSAPGIVKIHHPDEGVKTNAAKLIWQALIKNSANHPQEYRFDQSHQE